MDGPRLADKCEIEALASSLVPGLQGAAHVGLEIDEELEISTGLCGECTADERASRS